LLDLSKFDALSTVYLAVVTADAAVVALYIMLLHTVFTVIAAAVLAPTAFAAQAECSWDAHLLQERQPKPRKVIDISRVIEPGAPIWESATGLPDDYRRLVSRIDEGQDAYISWLSLGAHTLTHFDAPSHYLQEAFESGKGIESINLDIMIGPALVVETPPNQNISAEALESLNLPTGVERVLFKTSSSAKNLLYKSAFDPSYVALTTDGARWLGKTNIKFVGIDYLSIARFADITEAHRALLGQGIIPVEGLDLTQVEPGVYDLVCLPLKIHGSDGAPGRCVLRT
jgi:kynurenine formamidase